VRLGPGISEELARGSNEVFLVGKVLRVQHWGHMRHHQLVESAAHLLFVGDKSQSHFIAFHALVHSPPFGRHVNCKFNLKNEGRRAVTSPTNNPVDVMQLN
jgi:hypothetical protein